MRAGPDKRVPDDGFLLRTGLRGWLDERAGSATLGWERTRSREAADGAGGGLLVLPDILPGAAG